MAGSSRVSSTPQLCGSIASVPDDWIARFSRAMTEECNDRKSIASDV
jgi:hypothetical protein